MRENIREGDVIYLWTISGLVYKIFCDNIHLKNLCETIPHVKM